MSGNKHRNATAFGENVTEHFQQHALKKTQKKEKSLGKPL